MTERIARFGKGDNLLGIFTDPDPAVRRADAPAILWLNAGTLHHVGPFGWYVTMARRFAELGFVSLRFDLAGIGDSPATGEPTNILDGALEDVHEAIELVVRSRQVERVILVGLCSGAVLAHHAALRDPRVAGAIFFDGIGYKTPGFHLRHYGPRLLKGSAWIGTAARLVKKATGQATAKPELLAESFFFDFPSKEQARADLAVLLRRGTRLLFLYTGGVREEYFNHRDQFAEMFGDFGTDRVEVEYWPDADHLYADLEWRRTMFGRVEQWMK